MTPLNRPPPRVLFVHNGTPYEAHRQYLARAGLHVSDAHADGAVAAATEVQPDIVVLDLECDGDTIAALKGDPLTKHIPIIALAELVKREQ
jgi:CheY-like chemotaxis protein